MVCRITLIDFFNGLHGLDMGAPKGHAWGHGMLKYAFFIFLFGGKYVLLQLFWVNSGIQFIKHNTYIH